MLADATQHLIDGVTMLMVPLLPSMARDRLRYRVAILSIGSGPGSTPGLKTV